MSLPRSTPSVAGEQCLLSRQHPPAHAALPPGPPGTSLGTFPGHPCSGEKRFGPGAAPDVAGESCYLPKRAAALRRRARPRPEPRGAPGRGASGAGEGSQVSKPGLGGAPRRTHPGSPSPQLAAPLRAIPGWVRWHRGLPAPRGTLRPRTAPSRGEAGFETTLPLRRGVRGVVFPLAASAVRGHQATLHERCCSGERGGRGGVEGGRWEGGREGKSGTSLGKD